MRYAIFSDLHGNRQAWEAALADMEALRAEVHVCLGDIVG
ncbi:MAG: metallophosphoesterase family protein, partial [Akkermansiaceae bacterium]|nr:metallophosphoesterase family protein [Akkermansiaceae bacterium]